MQVQRSGDHFIESVSLLSHESQGLNTAHQFGSRDPLSHLEGGQAGGSLQAS